MSTIIREAKRRMQRNASILLGALAIGIFGAGLVGHASAEEKGSEAGSVTPAFAYDLPNLPGQTMTAVLVEYPPGASSPPHHHTDKGSVVAYVLEGAIRSKVNEDPPRVYKAGESCSSRRALPTRSARTRARASLRASWRSSSPRAAPSSRPSTNKECVAADGAPPRPPSPSRQTDPNSGRQPVGRSEMAREELAQPL